MEAELRDLARQYMRRERPGHVLQPTALVNEAFIRLLSWRDVSWQSRAHFLAMAARLMRHILVDISRRRAKDCDGREIRIVEIGEAEDATVERSRELVAVDDALRALADTTHGRRRSSSCDSSVASRWRRSRTCSTWRRSPSAANGRRRVRGCTGRSAARAAPVLRVVERRSNER